MSSRHIERSTFHMTPSSDPIDDAYNAFETAWRDGARPRIEEYLDVAPPAQRRDFLEALFYLELDYRQRFDEIPTPQEYLERFPQHADLVRQVFDDALISLGEYRVLEKVGEGGMGKVFKARHSTMNRVVALKVLPKSHTSDAQAVARFRQEVEIVARLNDPHVVQAFDAGSSRGTHFLVMEFVDGLDLSKLVKQRGPLPTPLACEIIRQAASGLAHAHEHGIVHRDIKPSNLILNKHGVVKLLDLGLARRKFDAAVSQGLTNPGAIMGTADYMAPEQWDSARHVDIRADIYSLGCTLYYLLTGCPPYGDPSNSTFQQKMRSHTASPVPDIRASRPDCPEELCRVLARLLAKDASQRYATPAEVMAAVAPLAADRGMKDLVAGTLEYPTVRMEPPSSSSQKPAGPMAQVDTNTATRKTLKGEPRSASISISIPANRVVTGLAIAVVLLFVLAAAALVAWQMFSRPPRDAAVMRQRLATVPGLNGGWWFHETPWLVPSVRAELLSAVDRGEIVVDGVDLRQLSADLHQASDVPDVYDRLKKASESLVKQRFRGPERTLLLDLFSNDPEQLSDEKFDQLLSETLRGLTALPNPTPEQSHLRAVLHQQLAQWDEAEAAYAAAQTGYEGPAARFPELNALLLSDYGRMLSDRGSMQSSSRLMLAQHESEGFQAPAFEVALLCLQAESKQRDGALDEAVEFIQQAIALAEKSLAPAHPLVAAAHEKYGWTRLDQYRLSQAKEQFAKGAALREQGLSGDGNHRALRYVLHDRQGEYMCEYFLGNHAAAIEELRQLIAEKFDKPLAQEGDELTPKERRELLERLPNTWERLGDCYLLGTREFVAASKAYEKAVDKAHLARWDESRYAPDAIRLRYKLAIALAMSGPSERERAVKVFATAEPTGADVLLNEKQKLRYALAKGLAEARIALAEPSSEKRLEGFHALGGILKDPQPLLRDPGSVNRDDLSLLLLAAHVFFESDTIAAEMPSERQMILGDVADSMWGLCQDPLRESSGELDAFVKPYLASVRSALEASLRETDSPALKSVLEKLRNE